MRWVPLRASAPGYDVNGRILGCDVVISGNVPANLGGGSNETRIIAADMREVYLWELSASPIFIRAEQPNAASPGILYVAYSYSAFGAGRQPKAISAVSGTGMILLRRPITPPRHYMCRGLSGVGLPSLVRDVS